MMLIFCTVIHWCPKKDENKNTFSRKKETILVCTNVCFYLYIWKMKIILKNKKKVSSVCTTNTIYLCTVCTVYTL